jgi:hypothetical protein
MINEKQIIESGYYYIKPAANHILTVGKGIIKDSYTAILELVKNAYDADAENVYIKLIFRNGKVNISIDDDGHGMSYSVVTQKWMVPSTADKLRQKFSRYKKRALQGRKGIGRYAASILGDELFLQTTEKENLITTELLINWNDFTSDQKFLEEIDILIESYKQSNISPGTKLNIIGDKIWTDRELDELIISLKRLLSPFDEIETDFKIHLEISHEFSKKYHSFSEYIKPLPILEFYHYRVSGTIRLLEDGKLMANLLLENKHLKNILPQEFQKEIIFENDEKYCGDISIDIRAFDLDENLLIKNDDISITEAKKQLKELPGIAVIREGFRVRPYGDRKVDWLGLNERRYNNPTTRLSSNQVAGYVSVLQEDESHLEEKATREGFKEDEYYEGLKQCILQSLTPLENLRYSFRKQHNKGGRKPKSVTENIQEASNFTNLNNKISTILSSGNIDANVGKQIKEAIEEEEQTKKEQFEEIKRVIAQYEGQVTLGKIMTVVFHEGRKPLNALKQHPRFITEWINEFNSLIEIEYKSRNEELDKLSSKIIDRLYDNKEQAEIFINIFKKLEPLANNKRPSIKEFQLNKPIQAAFKLFDLAENKISYSIIDQAQVTYKGWETDFYIAFANLIENSIHWMSMSEEKIITVTITDEDDKAIIEYSDTGTGIDEENISTQDIFDPGFSTKVEGTGLGLSIAGEALERNKGRIRAISSEAGANFIIELTK